MKVTSAIIKTSLPLRYVPRSLSKEDRMKQMKELERSKELYRRHLYHTRDTLKSFHSTPSKHTQRARNMYRIRHVYPNENLATKTGCSLPSLQKIVQKGEGAYFSSGSRPNQTPQSWGLARLASAITGGKAAAIDYNILSEGCRRRSSRALKLAQNARRRYGFGRTRTRKVFIS